MKDATKQADFYRKVGENIRRHRKEGRLSQGMLAQLVGLTRTSLTNIENGRQHPPVHTLWDISEKLQVNITELLPLALPPAEAMNITAMVGNQLRGEDELAFIKSGIGITDNERGLNGNTETEDTGASRDVTR